MWLLAELTYRCPLHCVFCYNPVDYAGQGAELSTDDWKRVLREGRALGAAQLGLSGGEPLLRDDLEAIVREARQLGYYINLLTSGVGLTETRIAALRDAGLDHIQLSFQDSTREMNDFLSSTRTFDLKNRVAQLIKQYDYPMVLNCVLHRYNIDHVQQILEMAEAMGAEYVELANTQYYSWAYLNREQLMPTREQVERAEAVTDAYREKVKARMRLFFVPPDYHGSRPKKCTNGWGQVFMTVRADGSVLPCHTAGMLPGLEFPNVREHSLAWAWYDSPGFNRFRGTAWMKEPCRSCPEQEKDLGGCRCQAWMMTGDAEAADPVCDRSPHHAQVTDMVAAAGTPAVIERPVVFRTDRTSRALIDERVAGTPTADRARLFEPALIADCGGER
nr:pyrroloquinoline quinone biosynthesis protein PqqE [Solimonas marina]